VVVSWQSERPLALSLYIPANQAKAPSSRRIRSNACGPDKHGTDIRLYIWPAESVVVNRVAPVQYNTAGPDQADASHNDLGTDQLYI